MGSLDVYDFVFINNLFINIIIIIYFSYLLFNDKKNISTIIDKCSNLSYSQFFCLIILACIAVFSSVLLLEFDSKHNTPLLNTIFINVSSAIILVLVGIFLFREKYNSLQIIGIIIAIFGIFLITQKSL